jgi:hypothetical protein
MAPEVRSVPRTPVGIRLCGTPGGEGMCVCPDSWVSAILTGEKS